MGTRAEKAKVEEAIKEKPEEYSVEKEILPESKEIEIQFKLKEESLEAVTARSVIALLYAVEQLTRARNTEIARLLAERRGELETAIGALEEE